MSWCVSVMLWRCNALTKNGFALTWVEMFYVNQITHLKSIIGQWHVQTKWQRRWSRAMQRRQWCRWWNRCRSHFRLTMAMNWSELSNPVHRIRWMPSNGRLCLYLPMWDRQCWAIRCRCRCPNRVADKLRSVELDCLVQWTHHRWTIRCLDVDWHEWLH